MAKSLIMADIVERLRADGALTGYYDAPAIQREAADEIERLRADVAEAIDQRNAADFVLASAIKMSSRRSAERDAARAEAARLREALRHLDAIASTGVLHQSSLNHAGLVELLEEARGVARAALLER